MITAQDVSQAFDEYQTRNRASARLDSGTSLSSDTGERTTTEGGIAAQFYLSGNIVRNVGDIIASHGGVPAASWASRMLDMSDEDAMIFASSALFPTQRKRIIRDTRIANAKEKWGDAVDNPTMVEQLVGGGAKQLIDPTTWLGIGLTMKSGALAVGLVEGATGAALGVTEGWASPEGVDPVTVATYTALGFGLGAGTAKATEVLSSVFKTAKEVGTPVKPDEAIEALRRVFNDQEIETILKSTDISSVVGKLNAEFKLGGGKSSILSKEISLEVNTSADSTDYIRGLKKMYNQENPGSFDVPEVTYTSHGEILKDIYADPSRGVVSKTPFATILKEGAEKAGQPGRLKRKGLSKKQERAMIKKKQGIGDPKLNPTFFGGRGVSSWDITPENMAAREYAQAADSYHDFVNAVRAEREIAEKVFDGGGIITKRVYEDAVGGPQLSGYSASGEPGAYSLKYSATDLISTGSVKYGSATGDMIVPSMKDPEAAMQSLLDDSIVEGKRSWYSNMFTGHIASRPWKVLEGRGKFGAALAKGMDEAFRKTSMRWSDFMHNFNKVVIESGSSIRNAKDMQIVSGLLRRTIRESDVENKELIDIVRRVEKDLARVLSDARDTGIISEKKYLELSRNAREKGYFPRVYNEDFLASKEGRKLWEDTLTGHVFSNEVGAKAAIRSLVGDESLELKKLMDGLVRKGNSYVISRALAKNLWDLRGKAQSLRRSTHLETSRKIPEEFENLLEPFLLNNPHAVLGKYYQDTLSRIESARIFGANDEVAAKLLTGLSKEEYATKDLVDMAADVYYQSVRSNKSSTLSKALNVPDWAKTLSGRARAFQTQKLAFAQIINLGQGTINGTTRLQAFKGSNPAKAYANALKGIGMAFKSLRSRELNDHFLRSGANAQSALIQQMGELGGAMSTITGRKFTGLLSPLEFLNNPSVMLRMSGFTAVEEFNRRIGYFMGKAHLDDLIARKTALLAKGNRANPKAIAKIDEGLAEIGLDPKMDPSLYSLDDVQMALQKISSEINFVNAAHTLPTFWNSFSGKIFGQFKTFAFHQGTFIKDFVLTPLIRDKNPMPLITYAGVGTPIGMSIYEFRKFIAGDDKEYTKTQEYLGWLTSFGGLGIMMDVLMQGAYGPTAVTASLAGPSIGTAANATAAMVKTVTDTVKEGEFQPKPIGKALLKEFQYPMKKKIISNMDKEMEVFNNRYKNLYVD